MPAVCKNCGCSEIDSDATRGDAVCTNCGSVIYNQIIVAEVGFEENSAGGANVIGQFISAEGGRSFSFGGTFRSGNGQDPRQATLANGKFMINSCGSQLKFSPHCLETAFMFYKLAVSKRLTQGRRLPHVIGACLYLVSRTEKTPHLLIDVSDACQVDLRLLGKTYLLLVKEMCIEVPMLDPCLYIHRFTHQLGFKEKENEIAMTAVRIVARMKRDWLQYGRRPSGLCGAALVVAARLHGYKIGVAKVVKVVRVAQATLVKRLHDFARTPTSRLTIDEFHKVDLEEEMDPPSFTAGRNRLKHAQIFEEKMNLNSVELLAQVAVTQQHVEKFIDKRKQIEEHIANTENLTVSEEQAVIEMTARKAKVELPVQQSDDPTDGDVLQQIIGGTSNLSNLASYVDEEPQEGEGNEVMEELDLDGLDEDELDDILLGDSEVEIKTKVWMDENEEYLEKMKEKEEQAAKELAENKDKPKRKKYTKRKRGPIEASTADEAIKTMLAEKKLSTKINYDVLRGLKEEVSEPRSSLPKLEMKLETVIESGPVVKLPKRKLKSSLKTPSLFGGGTPDANKKNISFTPQQSTSGAASKATSSAHVDVHSEKDAASVEKRPIESTIADIPADEVVIESGPIAHVTVTDHVADEEDAVIDIDHDNVSASQLFGQGSSSQGYDDFDAYDEDDTFY